MFSFGLQLWSIRDHLTTTEGIESSFREIAEMGYTSVQTAGTYDFISPYDFRRIADDNGIRICGTHYDWNRIANDISGTAKYHKILGAPVIGIGGMPASCMDSVNALNRFIDQFNTVAREYAKEGFTLSYHNHAREFCRLDGKTIFDRLIDGLDPTCTNFCLDTYWAQYGGMDICRLIRRLSGRIVILHLKDMTSWRSHRLADGGVLCAPGMIELGRGNFCFPEIISAAQASGVQEFIVEDEYYSNGNSMDSVRVSADYLKNNIRA